jgi:protein phosphatase
VHDAIREEAARDPRLVGMGTTYTGILSVGLDVFVLHIGDSKVFWVSDDELSLITHDHTVAQQYADLGLIRQSEVAGHRLHNVLTQAVGGPDQKLKGETNHFVLGDGDRLLMCSDGLTDMVSEEEIAAILKASPASQEACQALIARALEQGGRDNVTAIVAGYRVA